MIKIIPTHIKKINETFIDIFKENIHVGYIVNYHLAITNTRGKIIMVYHDNRRYRMRTIRMAIDGEYLIIHKNIKNSSNLYACNTINY